MWPAGRRHGQEDPVRILLLNGPNLSQLGQRDPAVYGRATLGELVARAEAVAESLGAMLQHEQHEAEGDLVAAVHTAVHGPEPVDAIIINAGALTHYGLSLRDALELASVPKIELHLSNTQARESFRHVSVIAGVCDGIVAGLGAHGYDLAIRAAVALITERRA
jgi:3-dehydroquinate dehydratase II